jgi:hypothetical protein
MRQVLLLVVSLVAAGCGSSLSVPSTPQRLAPAVPSTAPSDPARASVAPAIVATAAPTAEASASRPGRTAKPDKPDRTAKPEKPDVTPKPTKKPSAFYTPPGWRPGRDVNCPDFPSHQKAQEFFVAMGGSRTRDPYGLDSDSDGIACES